MQERKQRHSCRIIINQILTEVWGNNYLYDFKIVDVNIRRIRNKIEDDPSKPKYIQTIWGYGYCFRKED